MTLVMSAKRTNGRWVVYEHRKGEFIFLSGSSQRGRGLKKNATGWRRRSDTKRSLLAWGLSLRNRTAIMGLQVSIRESGDVTILDLQGRATIGADSDLLNSHLQKLVANGVRKLLLNLA